MPLLERISNNHVVFASGVVVGAVLTVIYGYSGELYNLLPRRDKKGVKFIYKSQSDDDCNSLFYGDKTMPDGKGFPYTKTCPETLLAKMRIVHPEYSHLPKDLYSQVVANLTLTCVDIICRRKSDGKILLFYRKDKPVCDTWWFPGGRMFRGETFFEAAIRKVADEMGNPESKKYIHPISVTHVWNTFFPDSNWDDSRKEGYEGTQTVNIVVLCECEDLEMNTSAAANWAVSNHRWVSIEEILTPGAYDKYVYLNVDSALKSGLLR